MKLIPNNRSIKLEHPEANRITKVEELMLDPTSLLSTLLGGALTIAGGFIATYYTQRTSSKSEKKKFLREKIEEIYNLNEERRAILFSCLINHLRHIENDKNYDQTVDHLKVVQNSNRVINKIALDVDLYFPEIKKSLNESVNMTTDLVEIIDETFDLTELSDIEDSLRKSVNIFQDEILNLIDTIWYLRLD